MANAAEPKSAESNWGDDGDQQTLGEPPRSPTRLITLFIVLGVVLLAVVIVKLGAPPPRDPTSAPAVGKQLDKLQLMPLDGHGEPLTLTSLQGKVTLITFWGPWCGYCLEEFPQLMELREGLASEERFRFVSVSCMPSADEEDLEASTRAYLRSKKYELPVHRDSTLATRIQVAELNNDRNFGFPTTVLLDQEGTIRAVWTGYQPNIGEEMRKQIDKLLAK